MVIKGYRVGPLVKKTFREINEDNVGSLAASAAYNFFFSLFPLLLFLAPLLSLFGDKQRTLDWLITQLTAVLPENQIAAVRVILDNVVLAKNAPGLISLGLVLAAWSGSNVFGTLITSLNTAYDVRETRSWLTQQLIRVGAFVLGGIVVIASTIIFLNGEGIANWVGHVLHLTTPIIWLWKIGQFPVAAAGLVGLSYLIFYLLPNVQQRRSQVLVAAVVTTLLWIVATLIFRLYITHFPPNPAYGVIGGVIILLTWMYYTMFVVMIGGELASELHHGTGMIAPDKGAIYLGRIVSGSGPGSASVERM